MLKNISLPLAAILLIASALLAGNAAPYDPWVGTWTLDIARSKFVESYAKPKSQTIVVEFAGETTLKFVSEVVEADGKKTRTEFTTAYDGQDTAVAGSALIDAVSVTQPRPHYRTYVLKKAGAVVSTNDVVLWGSGLLMTITSKEARGGQSIENVLYYRKKLAQ